MIVATENIDVYIWRKSEWSERFKFLQFLKNEWTKNCFCSIVSLEGHNFIIHGEINHNTQPKYLQFWYTIMENDYRNTRTFSSDIFMKKIDRN